MMKRLLSLLSFVFVLLLVSCGSKKNTVNSTGSDPMLEKQPSLVNDLQTIISKSATEPCITAKVNLNLTAGQKSTRVGGSLKMKRDDVIQLSLVALGIMEAGRLELTPDYVMVIDRVHHQFVKCGYEEVSFFRNTGIDFYTFQSLFWDEWFTLNGKGENGEFDIEAVGDELQLKDSQNRHLNLTFLLKAANKVIRETRFSRKESESPVLRWEYADWTTFGERPFPGSMKISFALEQNPVEAVLKIGNVKADSDWETRTEINRNRYSEVSLQTAFNRIMSLAE